MLSSELTNTIEQLIVYVHRNEAHFTNNFMYIIHIVFEADNIYKNPPRNGISPIEAIMLRSLFSSGVHP